MFLTNRREKTNQFIFSRQAFVLTTGLMVLTLGLTEASGREVPVYGYEVINVYPHDSSAFTQGLIFKDSFLYEGTGRYGQSSLRKVELETGNVLKIHNLADTYFGEGITIFKDTIIQLTWTSHVGFVYVELDTFEPIDTFTYLTEGWGITHDGTHLIMSDGSSTLHFLNPQTYEDIYQIVVTADGANVTRLNELEYIQGRIYSNVWLTDSIAIIDPQTGEVVAWLNMQGLLGSGCQDKTANVLNGIAFDADSVRLFVTGKLWPSLYEINVVPLNYPPAIVSSSPASPCSVEVDSILLLSVSAEDPDPEDTLKYVWSINGEIDTSAHDSTYSCVFVATAVDTVKAEVTDGMFSDSTSWTVLVLSTGVETEYDPSPHAFPRSQSFPNPFSNSTTIAYVVPRRTHVSIEIYDVSGRMVKRIVDEEQKAGNHSIAFAGKELKSGIYLAKFLVGDYEEIRKLILIR